MQKQYYFHICKNRKIHQQNKKKWNNSCKIRLEKHKLKVQFKYHTKTKNKSLDHFFSISSRFEASSFSLSSWRRCLIWRSYSLLFSPNSDSWSLILAQNMHQLLDMHNNIHRIKTTPIQLRIHAVLSFQTAKNLCKICKNGITEITSTASVRMNLNA